MQQIFMNISANIALIITGCYLINSLIPLELNSPPSRIRKLLIILTASFVGYTVMYFAIQLENSFRMDLRYIVIFLLAYYIDKRAALYCAFLMGLLRFTLSMDAAAIFGLLSLLVFAFISSLFIPFLKRKWSDKLNLIILNLFSLLLSSVNLLVFQDLTQFAIVIILLTTFFSFLTLFFVSYVIHDMERSRLARLEEKELAYTDFLTGLANVRSFNQLFHQFTHAENPPSLNLLILDIDFFKNVNDTYGHSVGDKVLQDIAHVLRKNAPNYDYLFRVGGEEFCLLLPKITLEEASETAEKIREAVENLLIDIGSEQPISVTISAGLASSELHPNEYLKLYQMADKALYSAKKKWS